MDTPISMASSRRSSLSSLDGLEDDAFYLANYVPLSGFPTPPPSSDYEAERKMSYEMPTIAQPELQGPAIHLANLVPTGLCKHRASPSVTQNLLRLSALPLETIALAACVLDALSSRFDRKLRKAFEEANLSSPRGPEVIILAALALANSYHADEHLRSSHWTSVVASGAFDVQQFNITSRSILSDIDYSLHSFSAELIKETMQDMQRIGNAIRPVPVVRSYFDAPKHEHQLHHHRVDSALQGDAIQINGMITPAPSC